MLKKIISNPFCISYSLYSRADGVGPGANRTYNHLLPFGTVTDDQTKTAVGRTASFLYDGSKKSLKGSVKINPENDTVEFGECYEEDEEEDYEDIYDRTERGDCGWARSFCCPSGYAAPVLAPTSIQKIEPKIFFANERTFLHWLHSAVTLMTVSSAILAFAPPDSNSSHWYAFALMAISLGFCIYALQVLLWRAERIKSRIPGRWDDPRGPILLGGTLAVVLLIDLFVKIDVLIKLN